MSIRDDSKKIIRFFLSKAIESGKLFDTFTFQYEELANTLDLKSWKYCRVCCQYLMGNSYISLQGRKTSPNPESNDIVSLNLTVAAIDFLET